MDKKEAICEDIYIKFYNKYLFLEHIKNCQELIVNLHSIQEKTFLTKTLISSRNLEISTLIIN